MGAGLGAAGGEVISYQGGQVNRIPGPAHLQDAYQQAKSYALRLQADLVALAATEGIWVVPKHRGAFALERAKHFTWAELDDPDRLHELRKVMGREVALA